MPGVCDTDTILHRGRVPKDIVIVGGGPVGVEFATICHALGAQVTLVDRGTRLMAADGRRDRSVMEALFTKWGVHVPVRNDGRSRRREGRRAGGQLSDRRNALGRTRSCSRRDARRTRRDRASRQRASRVDARGRVVVDENFRTSARGSTPPATFSGRRSPRSRWSRAGPRSATRSTSRSRDGRSGSGLGGLRDARSLGRRTDGRAVP